MKNQVVIDFMAKHYPDAKTVMVTMDRSPIAMLDGFVLMNAPRPLLGHTSGLGDFVTGRFYVAIDLAAENARSLIEENLKLDAVILLPMTEAEQELVALHGNRYRDAYLEMDAEDRKEGLMPTLSGLYRSPISMLGPKIQLALAS